MSSLETMERSVRRSEPAVSRPPISAPAIGQQPANVIGILHNTLLPSLGLHGSMSLITYTVSRSLNRVEIKDYLWPSGMVLNAWWSAVGRYALRPSEHAGTALNYYQKVLLGAVTAWGARLAIRIVSRSVFRKEESDDPRYYQKKQEPSFWNKSALALFALEAAFQAIISLPFTVPFRQGRAPNLTGATGSLAAYTRLFAASLFSAGFALESLADWQLEAYKTKQVKEQGENTDLYTGGVWSIVRHPNYLGDTLCHLAFPIWTYGSQLFSPWQLLGPVANYVFLRYVGGDKENEATQLDRYSRNNPKKEAQLKSWRSEKNSFWPGFKGLLSPWALSIAGIGVLGAVAEAYSEGTVGGFQAI